LSGIGRQAYWLVIIDLQMPEVDGCDVIEWLRANPPTQNVPVILVSGKVLSSEHIQRLEFTRVLFQSKNILENEEAGMVL
jgi:CheY-like chemotaxis protein